MFIAWYHRASGLHFSRPGGHAGTRDIHVTLGKELGLELALRSRGAEYRARVILRRVMGMEPEEAVERGLRRLMWVMPRQEAVETYLALHPAVDRRLVERLAEKLGGQENTI